MELLLLLIFFVSMILSILPNAFIQRARLRLYFEEKEIPTESRTWYDNWANGILGSNRSSMYQILFLVFPVILCLIGYTTWIIGQFPSSNWPPFLIGILLIHVFVFLLRIGIQRWTRKTGEAK